jgi:predicted ferric reductase
MVEGTQGPAESVEVQQTSGQSLTPHRGVVVLVLGILGLVVCFICGIIAWVMGNNDLRQMDAGAMDPSGRGMTQAGKICGMISVILAIIVIVIWLLIAVLAGASAVVAQ